MAATFIHPVMPNELNKSVMVRVNSGECQLPQVNHIDVFTIQLNLSRFCIFSWLLVSSQIRYGGENLIGEKSWNNNWKEICQIGVFEREMNRYR
jgi:hypothetical protein